MARLPSIRGNLFSSSERRWRFRRCHTGVQFTTVHCSQSGLVSVQPILQKTSKGKIFLLLAQLHHLYSSDGFITIQVPKNSNFGVLSNSKCVVFSHGGSVSILRTTHPYISMTRFFFIFAKFLAKNEEKHCHGNLRMSCS